jgi:hypothetical protein
VDISRHKTPLLHNRLGHRRQRPRRLKPWLTFQWPMREPHHPAQPQPQHPLNDCNPTALQQRARTRPRRKCHRPPVLASIHNRSNPHPLPHSLVLYLHLGQLQPKAHQHSRYARQPNRTPRRRERSRSPALRISRALPSMSPVRSPRRVRCRGVNGEILRMLGHNMRLATCPSQISLRWLQDC